MSSCVPKNEKKILRKQLHFRNIALFFLHETMQLGQEIDQMTEQQTLSYFDERDIVVIILFIFSMVHLLIVPSTTLM